MTFYRVVCFEKEYFNDQEEPALCVNSIFEYEDAEAALKFALHLEETLSSKIYVIDIYSCEE